MPIEIKIKNVKRMLQNLEECSKRIATQHKIILTKLKEQKMQREKFAVGTVVVITGVDKTWDAPGRDKMIGEVGIVNSSIRHNGIVRVLYAEVHIGEGVNIDGWAHHISQMEPVMDGDKIVNINDGVPELEEETVNLKEVRKLVANFLKPKTCRCFICDIARSENRNKLASLLEVEKKPTGIGYNWSKYQD